MSRKEKEKQGCGEALRARVATCQGFVTLSHRSALSSLQEHKALRAERKQC